MTRDTLILLHRLTDNPAFPGQLFYCEHCVLMEGVLACFPELAERLDVERVAWPRPRGAVVARIGEENQDLPVLILAEDAPDGLATGTANGRRFVAGKDAILAALAARHGIPLPHP
jgi:hypothetical protein